MAVMINGWDSLPRNCYDCDLHNYHECDLTTESIEEDYCWNGDSREKHCPLREVEAIPKDQYEARLKADMADMLDEIRAEIVELTKCPYGTECLGANCPSNTDCMICGDHVLDILDKYKAEQEEA